MNIGVMVGIVSMIMIVFAQCIFILAWTPNQIDSYVVYLMMIAFAFTQSVANSQIRGREWGKKKMLR